MNIENDMMIRIKLSIIKKEGGSFYKSYVIGERY